MPRSADAPPRLEPYEPEAAVVRRIFDDYVAGGHSTREITRRLNADGVMEVMMQESVAGLCGPKGVHDPDRTAVRHGSEDGSVTLGGRRAPVRRPRVRSADGTAEVAIMGK